MTKKAKYDYKIKERKVTFFLFLLCWIVYFSTYLGRLNYSAVLSEMIATGSLNKAWGGMIGTGFFLAYGIGQIVSGFSGDRFSPKWLVFFGLFLAALMNGIMYFIHLPAVMLVVWTCNGFAQAFIWSPMLRLLCEYLEEETSTRYCVSLNSSIPLGTMSAYAMTGLIIAMAPWKMVFLTSGILLLLISLLWIIGIQKIEYYAHRHGEKVESREITQKQRTGVQGQAGQTPTKTSSVWSMVKQSGLVIVLIALVIQGALKDGVTTWIPTYMNEIYHLGSVMAIMTTMIIPVFNLIGVFLSSAIDKKFFHNEIKTSGVFFIVCSAALFFLWLSSGNNVFLAFFMLTISTTTMMAVNTMLVAMVPARFGRLGKASTVSGILNSFVYIGGAASTYGIGTLSGAIGWQSTIFVWVVMAILASLVCFVMKKKWKRYQESNFL